jgi:hypothetical protein
MTVALITIFVVPTLYCFVEEFKLRKRSAEASDSSLSPAIKVGN